MGKTFLLLLLALQSLLAIDVGLRRLCLSPHLDSPTESKEPKSRIKGKSCQQTFPYVGTPEQHDTFCRSRMPYDSTVVKRTDTSVTCKWELLTARCDHSKKKRVYQINGKCFTAKDDCSKEGLSRAKPATIDHLRWLSIFYRNSETALRVEASKAFNLRKELHYDNGNVLKGGKGDKKAMIIQRLTPFGLFPGDLLSSDSSRLRELCLAKTKVYGSAASPLFSISSGSGDGEEERKKISSGSSYTKFPLKDKADIDVGFAFITRNDYTPQFADDDLVDLDHFHKQCEKICTDCFAASFEMFEEYQSQMPEGRFYAPAGRRDQTHDEACSAQFKMENRKRFNVKPSTHKSSKPYVPKGRHWWNGDKDSLKLPTASCADQVRTAVQLVHSDTLTYVDVPSFDRHPIVCISGPSAAAVEKEGDCFPNSKMSNGKCVCKDTYQDALEITEFRQEVLNLGFKDNGQICIQPQSCTEVDNSIKGVVFLVDGSEDVAYDDYDLAVDFVESFKDTIPNHIPVLFYQFSIGKKIRVLSKGWTKEDYVKTMKTALKDQLDSESEAKIYTHMSTAMSRAEMKFGKGDKILIVITNGRVGKMKMKTIRKRERLGYQTVIIVVGNDVYEEDIIDREEDNKDVSIYAIDDYSGLDVDLMKEVTETICKPWPEGHLMKAIYGDDWKEAT